MPATTPLKSRRHCPLRQLLWDPTVAGEVYFDKSYEGNPLVNAFCLGVLRHDQIVSGPAAGIGNPVLCVGPATGRDGVAGSLRFTGF